MHFSKLNSHKLNPKANIVSLNDIESRLILFERACLDKQVGGGHYGTDQL